MSPVQNWAQPTEKAQLTQERSLTDKLGLLGVGLDLDAEKVPKNDRVIFLEKMRIKATSLSFWPELSEPR